MGGGKYKKSFVWKIAFSGNYNKLFLYEKFFEKV